MVLPQARGFVPQPRHMSGSGFLMLAEGDVALIVTNEHVVTPPALPPLRGRPARVFSPSIEVVFNSGRTAAANRRSSGLKEHGLPGRNAFGGVKQSLVHPDGRRCWSCPAT